MLFSNTLFFKINFIFSFNCFFSEVKNTMLIARLNVHVCVYSFSFIKSCFYYEPFY